jgi:hypothetical protein
MQGHEHELESFLFSYRFLQVVIEDLQLLPAKDSAN